MTDPNLPAVPPNDGVESTPPSAAPQYVPAPPVVDAAPPAQQPAGSAPYGAPQYGAPQYGAAQYGAPQYGAPVAEQKYNVLAIISLVSAFFVSLVAIITGHIALSQIKRTGEKGRGLAIAGLVIGYVSIALSIIALIILIPVFLVAVNQGYNSY